MNRAIILLTVILCLVVNENPYAQDEFYNPRPLADDLVLPMPNGEKMVFRPVFIGVGDGPWALKEFKVGDRSEGGFKEYPTRVMIGGAFIADNPNKMRDWVYYIGKYEVTEAQYHSIVPGEVQNPQYPVCNISWFETQEFINQYNLWLYENALDQVPKHEGTTGYLRLPTEIEWEFAARGGIKVDALQFDKKHPYEGPLTNYEWFAGKKSSHGKIKKIGLLEPNPIGVHDMLGNVSEMTSTLYHIEYYQGRPGGFTLRGGNFFSSESEIRSSYRAEIPFYKTIKDKLTVIRQPTLGIRLVISSPIYTSSKTSQDLAQAWGQYREKRRPPAPPAQDHPETVAQVGAQINDLQTTITRLKEELKKATSASADSQNVNNQLNLIQTSVQDIDSIVQKAEFDSAYAFVKIASNMIYMICSREIKELPGKRKALETAQKLGKTALIESIETQIAVKEKNIREGLVSYGEMLIELEKARKETVEKAISAYRDFLGLKGAAEQLQATDLFKAHFEDYRKTSRADADKWRSDLEKM